MLPLLAMSAEKSPAGREKFGGGFTLAVHILKYQSLRPFTELMTRADALFWQIGLEGDAQRGLRRRQGIVKTKPSPAVQTAFG